MIDSFKNIERLRYRINSDLNEIKHSLDNKTEAEYEGILIQIPSAIMSAMVAGLITNSEMKCVKELFVQLLEKVLPFQIINQILGYIFLYLICVIIYFLFFTIVKNILKLYAKKAKGHRIVNQTKINFQKEFDNIACDSIFVAYEYKNEYESEKIKSVNLKTFYFLEILHYVEKACFTTRDLCMYKDEYMKIHGRLDGVDVYRVYNMVAMMQELLEYIESEYKKININKKYKYQIQFSISLISKTIENDIVKNIEK